MIVPLLLLGGYVYVYRLFHRLSVGTCGAEDVDTRVSKRGVVHAQPEVDPTGVEVLPLEVR